MLFVGLIVQSPHPLWLPLFRFSPLWFSLGLTTLRLLIRLTRLWLALTFRRRRWRRWLLRL